MFTTQKNIYTTYYSYNDTPSVRPNVESLQKELERSFEKHNVSDTEKEVFRKNYENLLQAIAQWKQEKITEAYSVWSEKIKESVIYKTVQFQLSQLDQKIHTPMDKRIANDPDSSLYASQLVWDLVWEAKSMEDGLKKAMQEQGKEMKEIVQKSWPMGMIAKLFDITPSSIAQKLQEWYEAKKNWDIFAGFGLIFTKMLAGIFKFDLTGHLDPKVAKEIGVKVKEEEKEEERNIDESKEKKSNIQYSVMAGILSAMAPKEAKSQWIQTLLSDTRIYSLTYQELEEKYKKFGSEGAWYKSVLNDLLGQNKLTKNTTMAERYIFELLFERKRKNETTQSSLSQYIHEKFAKKYPGKDIKTSSLREILLCIGSEINVLKSIASIDINKMASFNPSTMTENMQNTAKNLPSDMIKIIPNEDGTYEVKGEMADKVKSLWITNRVLISLLNPAWWKISCNKGSCQFQSVLSDKQTSKDTEALDKLEEFWKEYITMIVGSWKEFSFLDWGSVIKFINDRKLTQKDILKAYIASGGKTNFDEMNLAEKMGIYTTTLSTLVSDPTISWELTGVITKSMINEERVQKIGDTIPEDVKDFTGDHISSEKILEALGGVASSLGRFAKWLFEKNPALLWVIGAIVLLFPYAKRWTLLGVIIWKLK